ncbi:unnamed protein product [Lathyrus oleraceus]
MYDMMYPGRRVLKSNFEGVKKVYYVGICSRILSKRRRSKIPCVKCECRPIINDLEEVERRLKRTSFIENYWV